MASWQPVLAFLMVLALAPGAAARPSITEVEAGVTLISPTGVLAGDAIEVDIQEDGAPVTRPAALHIAVPPGAAYALGLPTQIQIAGRSIAVKGYQADLPLAAELVVGQHELAVGATLALDAHLPPGRYVAEFDVTLQNN
ncbi:MAG: hypothetical protein JWM80_127 [Cyanobacteria bacterium RYN_339]|nr:hypothetical protein [Cyanobacteria bacterium RYN_339]